MVISVKLKRAGQACSNECDDVHLSHVYEHPLRSTLLHHLFFCLAFFFPSFTPKCWKNCFQNSSSVHCKMVSVAILPSSCTGRVFPNFSTTCLCRFHHFCVKLSPWYHFLQSTENCNLPLLARFPALSISRGVCGLDTFWKARFIIPSSTLCAFVCPMALCVFACVFCSASLLCS